MIYLDQENIEEGYNIRGRCPLKTPEVFDDMACNLKDKGRPKVALSHVTAISASACTVVIILQFFC